MAKNYKVGEKYYLPVTVYVDKSDDGGDFPIGIKYNDGKVEIRDYIQDSPGLLLKAEEVADNDAQDDLVTAREAIDYLQEENNKLKEEMEGMDIAHKSLCECNFKYSHRLDDQYEVIRALVEKIRRLEKANETVCITKPV